jgi:hypothetical protein
MSDEIQRLKSDLAEVELCIPGCRDKVRLANAEYFRARKAKKEGLMATCAQRVKAAMLTLDENLKRRNELRARFKHLEQ